MNGLLNAGPCKCPTCTSRDATYATPADYDEALALDWVRWGSEKRTGERMAPSTEEACEAVRSNPRAAQALLHRLRPRRIRPWKTTGHLYDERTAG